MDPNPVAGQAHRVSGQVWRFADCEFDELRHELRVRGTCTEAEAKPLDVLRQLLLHAGEVLTKDELLESVWPGLLVVDGSLATAVSKLRKALGDESLVVTVPRVGYRLAVPVHSKTVDPPEWPDLHFSPGEGVPGRDQWRLVRRLDLTPSSEVWLAEHSKTHESRVFKFAPDAARLKGLKREVTLARLLRESLGDRPEFVRILEWNFDSQPYFVESEYCGPNLVEWAEAQGGLARIPIELRLRLLVDVAGAVAAAHGLDVLHKDLKPANLLVSQEPDGGLRIRVADFGSASLLAPARLSALGITNLGFTQTASDTTGSLTGTMMYIAPEVLAGQSPTCASDVYALGVLLYQVVIGNLRKPLAPGWEADIGEPLIRQDIADAACGDPARRLPSASELAVRLSNLDRRRIDAEARAQALQRAQLVERKRTAARARRPWLVLAVVAVAIAAAVSLRFYRSSPLPPPRVRAVAVLPFQNVGADTSIDFLRLALPDEVATILSHAPGLSVLPFATTSKYDRPNVDLQRAAQEMRVGTIVTGHFVRAGPQLHITMEAVDVDSNRVLWRDKVDAPGESMIATQVQIALRVKRGLAAILGASTSDAVSQPKNEEAYNLFLRSVALTFETTTNAKGIDMLERAVALDPTYAPAWLVLSRRYYVEGRYASDSKVMMERYYAAIERAAALDPDYVPGVASLIFARVERGDLVKAYEEAQDLVRRRPDSADAHFSMSYALRFAGVLDESAHHCDTAFLLDPQTQTAGLRSCAAVFLLRSDYPRAMNYLNIDRGSDFWKALSIHMLVREHKEQEALQIGSPQMPAWGSYDMLLACAARRPLPEIMTLARAVRPSGDPESNYFAAAHLAYCGQTEAALDMLREAINGSYCSYPAVDSDPMFASLRSKPEFGEIRAAGAACQNDFLARRLQRPQQ